MNTETETISSVPAAAPVAETKRISLLDALRGLSILGIAVVNVQFFACSYLRLPDWRWGEVSLSEAIVRASITFFAEHHFFSIFAMLFGMGLALQYRRVQEAGKRFGGLYFRRLFVLFLFGIAHAILLWFGDILALYALVGIVVFWFRNASSRVLLISAVILFLVPVVAHVVMISRDPMREGKTLAESKAEIVDYLQKEAASKPATTQEIAAVEKKVEMAQRLIEGINWMADDTAIYRSGSLSEMMFHRLICFALISPMVAITQMGWRALALMLFGIYLVKRGLFCTTQYSPDVYRRLTLIGLLIGLLLQIAGTLVHAFGPHVFWVSGLYFIFIYLGSMGMTLGYMGIVYLLYQRQDRQIFFRPLVAVGRMSLTCYIGSSVLFGLIFYGYGLGLMGQVSFFQAEILTAGVLIFLMVFSMVWLKIFQIGPLEWLWRVLTYLHFVPLLRRRA